jgi:hypothetical protein
LAWRRSGVSTGIAPQFDDEVAEPVHDKWVLVEAGSGLDVTHSAEPFGDVIELTKLLLQRGRMASAVRRAAS